MKTIISWPFLNFKKKMQKNQRISAWRIFYSKTKALLPADMLGHYARSKFDMSGAKLEEILYLMDIVYPRYKRWNGVLHELLAYLLFLGVGVSVIYPKVGHSIIVGAVTAYAAICLAWKVVFTKKVKTVAIEVENDLQFFIQLAKLPVDRCPSVEYLKSLMPGILARVYRSEKGNPKKNGKHKSVDDVLRHVYAPDYAKLHQISMQFGIVDCGKDQMKAMIESGVIVPFPCLNTPGRREIKKAA